MERHLSRGTRQVGRYLASSLVDSSSPFPGSVAITLWPWMITVCVQSTKEQGLCFCSPIDIYRPLYRLCQNEPKEDQLCQVVGTVVSYCKPQRYRPALNITYIGG